VRRLSNGLTFSNLSRLPTQTGVSTLGTNEWDEIAVFGLASKLFFVLTGVMVMGMPLKSWATLQLTNDDVVVNVGRGKDLIQNDSTPELIQVDLFFPEVTRDRFTSFLNEEITPRFPNGLTAFDGGYKSGQKVTLVFEDTEENEQSIYQVVDAFEEGYGRAVVEIVNENVAVGFGQGEDVIENDAIPELIQVDLYFGRNIGTTGQVTEAEFQQFFQRQIRPLFGDGLVVADARGQFLDSQQQLIREPSKVVSLLTVVDETIRLTENGTGNLCGSEGLSGPIF
jgi:hypothetical protein